MVKKWNISGFVCKKVAMNLPAILHLSASELITLFSHYFKKSKLQGYARLGLSLRPKLT